MGSVIGFEFPLDAAQQWDGFNDSGMEHFSGSPFEHLGREVPQNTLDAKLSADHPAKIEIKLIEVPVTSVPDIDGLKKTMENCLKASENESAKAKTFFQNATALLAQPKIKILQIADFNTKGVEGPCINGKPFFAFMKATGQSKKSSTDATGSYGIGKFAPFTVSGLRTIFVSTVWKDDKNEWQHYVQGKSILMSHDSSGKTRRATGFWGVKESCQPVSGQLKTLPDWLKRVQSEDDLADQSGTTLSILGFEGTKNWQNVMAANIAENFFGAIHKGLLEITIDGGPVINKETLMGLFQKPEISLSIIDQKNEPDKFNNIQNYLKALDDNVEVKIENTENIYLGNCCLRILVGEKLPKKVAFLRNGMLITDELAGLKRFGEFKEFVAVLECHSVKGNSLLRAMEPPRHDDFEPERLSTDKEKRDAKLALKHLTKWVKDSLVRHARDQIADVTNLDEMADWFSDEEDDVGKPNKENEKNPIGDIVIRARPVAPNKPRPPSKTQESAEEDGLPEQSPFEPQDGVVDRKNPNPERPPVTPLRPNDENESSSKRMPMIVGLKNVRAIPLTPSKRKITFTPDVTGKVEVVLQDSGADTNVSIGILSSNLGNINEGKIEGIDVKAGQRYTLEIELEKSFGGTLRVVANAV
jgi:hypothetical protein